MKSKDTNIIVYDAFRFVGTHGVPLELVLSFFKDNGLLIAWDSFVTDALKDGWKKRTIRARASAAIGDVFGEVYLKEWLIRMDKLLESIS